MSRAAGGAHQALGVLSRPGSRTQWKVTSGGLGEIGRSHFSCPQTCYGICNTSAQEPSLQACNLHHESWEGVCWKTLNAKNFDYASTLEGTGRQGRVCPFFPTSLRVPSMLLRKKTNTWIGGKNFGLQSSYHSMCWGQLINTDQLFLP